MVVYNRKTGEDVDIGLDAHDALGCTRSDAGCTNAPVHLQTFDEANCNTAHCQTIQNAYICCNINVHIFLL